MMQVLYILSYHSLGFRSLINKTMRIIDLSSGWHKSSTRNHESGPENLVRKRLVLSKAFSQKFLAFTSFNDLHVVIVNVFPAAILTYN